MYLCLCFYQRQVMYVSRVPTCTLAYVQANWMSMIATVFTPQLFWRWAWRVLANWVRVATMDATHHASRQIASNKEYSIA